MRNSFGRYGPRISLADITENHHDLLLASVILARVSLAYGVPWSQLIQSVSPKNRGSDHLSAARRCATWLIRTHLGWSYLTMAKLVFKCDHSTLVTRVQCIDPRTLATARRIEKELNLVSSTV